MTKRKTEYDYALEHLSEQVREALGAENDPSAALVPLVEGMAGELKELRRRLGEEIKRAEQVERKVMEAELELLLSAENDSGYLN